LKEVGKKMSFKALVISLVWVLPLGSFIFYYFSITGTTEAILGVALGCLGYWVTSALID
jgi:hypothetical protein